MRFSSVLITGVCLVALLVAGSFVYTYVKETPPDFLVKWVTNTKPPAPLPSGETAPFAVPEGFAATIFSRDVPGARVMTRDPKGALLVSLTREGKVVALPDVDGNGEADSTITVLDGLERPHGLVVRCPSTGNASADQDACILYVAETNAVKSYAYDADTFTARVLETLASLPSGGGHFTRTLLLHPDGEELLVSIGSSCNVCDEGDLRRASMQSINIVTGEMTPYAIGLRNTVFMATHPVTGELWGTDMGRDLIGDDIPPDEINIIEEGENYGWPICYGRNIHDTDFDKKQYIRDPCADMAPSHVDLQAHSAPLGLVFVPEEGWPEAMWHHAFVALHGSWNRSTPSGYKVVRVPLGSVGNQAGAPVDFMTGFLPAEGRGADDALGRPAGLLIEPGGIMFVSDDHAGAIYRITWQGE